MRKTTFITLLLCFFITAIAGATAPNGRTFKKSFAKEKFEKKKEAQKQAQREIKRERIKKNPSATMKRTSQVVKAASADSEIVLTEDFSKFTAGSETTPDATDIVNPNTGDIADTFTLTPGWTGYGIFQAGGTAYIGIVEYNDGDDTGYINTPYLDLSNNSGEFTLSFKAKSSSAAGDEILIFLVDSKNGEYEEYTEITNTWATYSFTFTEGDASSLIQIFPYESPCFIDDIQITQAAPTGVVIPKALPATNVTATGFTANWSEAANATSYLLSVYSYKQSGEGVQEVTVTEGFDAIKTASNKTINIADPNYPVGWTINVVDGINSRHIYTTDGNYYSAPLSLSFADTGDNIITPVTPAPMTEFSVWLKGQNGVADSYISFEANNGISWSEFANLDVSDYLDGEIVNLSSKLPAGTIQVKLTYEKGASNCSVDEVSYTYGGAAMETEYVFEERSVTGTSYDVSGLDADTQYYYRVKATDGTETSAYSAEIKVEGSDETELEIPVMLQATNISDAGFTANWQGIADAAVYSFYTFLTHTAPAEETYMLAHEDFNSVTAGEPEGDEYLDAYTNRPDWEAISHTYGNGMIGFDNEGGILSPVYEFSGQGKFEVEIKAQSALGDELYVSNYFGLNENDGEMKTLTFTSAEQTFVVEFDTHASANYPGNQLIFETSSNGFTYIDEIKITKIMSAGESVFLPYFSDEPEADVTSLRVETTDKMPGDSYAYAASAVYFDWDTLELLFSDFSDLMQVIPSSSVDRLELKASVYMNKNLHVVLDSESLIEVYSISGSLVESVNGIAGENIINIPQQGIYIVKTGNYTTKVVK